MRLKQGDLLPPLIVDLTDNGAPVDLTAATAVRIYGVRGATQIINAAGTVTDPTTGRVTRDWATGDTDIPGRIHLEVVVTWAGREQTFPPLGSLAVDIDPDELLP